MNTSPSALRRLQLRFGRAYYELVFAFASRNVSMFNYGVAPIAAEVSDDLIAAREPYQATLYAEVWRAAVDLGAGQRAEDAPMQVFEVSAGMGGGLAFLGRLSGAQMTALERSAAGRRSARKRGLATRPFEAPTLEIADGEADVIISVEAAHNYFSDAFAAELARALRPGGVLVMTDCPLTPFESQKATIEPALEAAGLSVQRFEDITERSVAAIRADTPRKMARLWWMPAPIRRMMMEALGCDPSEKFASLAEGRRGYYFLSAIKPAAQDQPR